MMLEKIISYLIVFLILSLYINLTIKNNVKVEWEWSKQEKIEKEHIIEIT